MTNSVHSSPDIVADAVALRHQLGLSQAQFARRFGLPVQTLAQWERGRRQPGCCRG
jgi:DNA-binding transcriptional regulator YiaG